jgi:hypothetical protein
MKSNINHLIVVLVTIAVTIGFLNFIPNQSSGKTIISFDNGGGDQTEWEIELAGETGYSSDSSTYFSVPLHKGKIQEASLKITCSPNDNGVALLNPRLDVGIDNDYEWEFTGKGYGSVNHQTLFHNNMDRRVVAIGKNNLYNTDTKIYLPKDAKITSAKMNVEGGDVSFSEVFITAVNSMNDVYYIKSNGDKTFGKPQFIENLGQNTSWPRSYSYGVGIGDFDNDGDNDIITNEGVYSWPTSTGNMYLIEKTGPNNTFASKQKVGTTNYYRNTDFAVGDFNNDNLVDFIGSEENKNIFYFKNTGGLTFNKTQIATSFSGGTVYGKDAADFNLDGYLDVVIGSSTNGASYVLEGDGKGNFNNEKKVQLNTGTNTRVVVAGDFNVDGNPDIIARDAQTWPTPRKDFQFARGKGDSTFFDSVDITGIDVSSWNLWSIYASDGFDFDFDGNQDLLTYNGNTIHIFWGNGNGQFSTSTQINGIPSTIYGVATPSAEILGGCDNMIIDVGEDGDSTPNFQPIIGPFDTIKEINFKDQLDSLLTTPSSNMESFTDEYGNTLYEIPIKFSASKIGNVMLRNMSIRYTYTTNVEINPHDENLVNELNDLIPRTGKGDYKVYLRIAADSPGKVKFSDLNIEFNEAPILNKNIPDLIMNEGTDQKMLKDLSEFYDDDSDPAESMQYSIVSNTNSEYLSVSIYNDHYLHANATKLPDWHGEAQITVQAEDSGNGITRSNEFTVRINPVNDPPRVRRPLTNIELKTNEVFNDIDLDDPGLEYFYDVDSPEMFFRAIITSETPNEFDDFLRLEIDNDTAVFTLRAFSNYKKNIPVRVYCSDSKAVRTMALDDLKDITTYQDFIVNITKFGMGKKPTFPPVWQDIEDIEIPEDTVKLDWINLNNYTHDPDDEPETIIYSIDSLTNSAFMNVFIVTSKDRTKNILSIIPELNFDGEAIVVIRAEDDEHNYALEKFKITINPEPDIPLVEILSPANNSIVAGVVTISGSAIDPEGKLKQVELKIGDNDWITTNGLLYWTYAWNTNLFSSPSNLATIKARAMDMENRYSELDIIHLRINTATMDSDLDGVPDVYDMLPNDPLDWLDSDGDGIGDNTDRFPHEPTQWDDIDEDGYGDNPSGKDYDMFQYDPTQWKDSDGDGFGDNLNGNDPDHYPEDDSRHAKSSKQSDESWFTTMNLIWLAVIPFVIIDILIIIFYIKKRKQTMEKKEEK